MNDRESLGSHLKRERESRNISLKEVAKKIRVREQLLRALEEDRYDLLPPHPYLKGFLFNYAKVVGLDPHEVILRYENAIQVKPTFPQEVPSEKKPQKEAEKIPEKKAVLSPRQFWIIGGVVVVSVILSLLFLFPPSKPPVETVSPKPGVSIKPEAKKKLPPSVPPQASVTTRVPETPPPLETPPAPEPTPVPEVAPVPKTKPLSLKLKAVEETWVRIQVDDTPEREMTFKPGDVTSHQAMTRIHLLVGNAGGLDVTLNGRLIEKFGKSGEVVTAIITPQGVETKLSEMTKPTKEE